MQRMDSIYKVKLNAKEARLITEESHMNDILSRVISSAKKGYSSLKVETEYLNMFELREPLNELGFKIEKREGFKTESYIAW